MVRSQLYRYCGLTKMSSLAEGTVFTSKKIPLQSLFSGLEYWNGEYWNGECWNGEYWNALFNSTSSNLSHHFSFLCLPLFYYPCESSCFIHVKPVVYYTLHVCNIAHSQ